VQDSNWRDGEIRKRFIPERSTTDYGGPRQPLDCLHALVCHYLIEKATNKDELQESVEILNWVSERALRSGVLAEQIDPLTGEPISVSPLTWSHAAFVIAVQLYMKKHQKMERCPQCGQPTNA
jgi:glucoamylase